MLQRNENGFRIEVLCNSMAREPGIGVIKMSVFDAHSSVQRAFPTGQLEDDSRSIPLSGEVARRVEEAFGADALDRIHPIDVFREVVFQQMRVMATLPGADFESDGEDCEPEVLGEAATRDLVQHCDFPLPPLELGTGQGAEQG